MVGIFPFCLYQGEALKSRCGGVALAVGVGSATFLNFQIAASNTHIHTHTQALWERASFPHLHKPSWKVYSLIPGPLPYKRAEDLGLFSLQSLSLLIREPKHWKTTAGWEVSKKDGRGGRLRKKSGSAGKALEAGERREKSWEGVQDGMSGKAKTRARTWYVAGRHCFHPLT